MSPGLSPISFGRPCCSSGTACRPSAKTDGLIQAYKVSTWDTIPAEAKDPDGFWYGDYYGVLAFEVNKAVVTNSRRTGPTCSTPHKNKIALAGDPRVSNQAIQRGLRGGPRQRWLARQRPGGLDFFKKLNDAGNFVPTIAKPGTIDQGATPITIRWTYNALAHGKAAGNPEIDVVVPKSGRFGGRLRPGDQRLRAASERGQAVDGVPLSDEGQNLWLKGYCHPIRSRTWRRGTSFRRLLAKLPDIAGRRLPDVDQLKRPPSSSPRMGPVVGADVK